MRRVLRWLDPWAASLVGVLVALGVVILLATPGPWHTVVEAPHVRLPPHRPTDIAVFVLGGDDSRCSAVVWLHADYDSPSLTASVLVPATQGLVPGGGYAPIDRLVTDVGPARASQALGRTLGVTMNAWATVDRQAMRLAVPQMFPIADQHAQRREYRRASAAWTGRGGVEASWRVQYRTLAAALPETHFEELGVVAFCNYVLGFGDVHSDLDLQGVASLGKLLQGMTAAQIHVRAVPAVVDRCRDVRSWRVDSEAVALLRGSLALGVTPPPSLPSVHVQTVRPLVLVADAPRGALGRTYLARLRDRLRTDAGAPVTVTALRAAPGETLAAAVGRALDRGRPLAVVVASVLTPITLPTQQAVTELEQVAAVLRERDQPGMVCAPATTSAEPALTAALARTGLPVAPAPPAAPPAGAATVTPAPFVWDKAAAVAAARANAATLVRACWPRVLSPRLSSTRIGFSFAAARAADVAVVDDVNGGARVAARLGLYGWAATTQPASAWKPPLLERAVYYRPGYGRAARALAGDLGLMPATTLVEPGAPAAVTAGLTAGG